MEKFHRGNYVRKIGCDYCVIDTETTGLSAYYDSVIEIGILKVRNNIVVSEYTQLIDPECELDPYITRLTGITDDMLAGKPKIFEVKEEVLAFIGDDLIVGHNTNFDMQFLANGFCYDFPNEYMDTLQFAKKLYPTFEAHNLPTLTYLLNLPAGGHRALSDTKSTKALFDCMVKKMQEENLSIEQLFPPKKKKQRSSYDIAQIVPTEDIDEDSHFYGKHCVFTGTLEKMVRKNAMQLVVNAGGLLDKNVISSTNYLIVGSFDYCSSIKEGKTGKLKKAESLKQKGQNIEIIDEHTFYDLLEL